MPARRPTAIVVLACGLAAVFWLQRPWTDTKPTPATAPTTTGDAPSLVAANDFVAPTTAPERDAVLAAARSFLLRGRCVDDAGGSPIAGAIVTAWADPDEGGRDAARSDATPVTTVATAQDGRFAVSVACTASLVMRVDAPGFARVTGRWRAAEPREVDVGDVRLCAATMVEGEVVDARGVPVEGAEVMLAVLRPESAGFAPAGYVRTESRADGRFVFAQPVAIGDWYAIVNNTGGLIAPRHVNVPAGVDRHFLRVMVTAPDPTTAIRGIVVDDLGAPMRGIDLRGNGDGATGSARTRDDGSFVLQRGGAFVDDGRGVALFVTDPTGDHELAAELPRVRWGATDVRIVLRRFAATTLVASTRGGAPIADYDAFVLPDGEGSAAPRLLAARGRTDGRLPVAKLRSGRYRIIVRPLDGTPPSAPVPLVVDQGRAPPAVHVVVEPPVDLVVEVVGANDVPVAGSRVEAILALAGKRPTVTATFPSLATARASDLVRPSGLVVGVGTTGADGRTTLPLHGGEYHVRVRGPLHAAVVQVAAVGGEPTTIRVAVEPAGRLLGRCEPIGALARLAALGGDAADGIAISAIADGVTGPTAAVGADGTFALDGLRPGTWSLHLLVPMRCNAEHASTVPLLLGDVVATTATQQRTFAIDALLPGGAAGSVTLDGAPWPLVQMFFHREHPRSSIRVTADAEGRFDTLLPPGDYRAAVAFAAQPGPGWIVVPQPRRWRVAADRDERFVLAVRTRSARIRVLDRQGAAIANARVRIDAGLGYHRPGSLATDAGGTVAIVHPPYGPFDLVVSAGGRDLRCGPIEVPDDVDSAAFDVAPRDR